jgi:ribonuclease BN (tRNA processing enzyme)
MNTPYIYVLGTGSSVPEAGNAPASYLISYNHKLILIDAGPGVAQNIVDAGFSLKDIHTICITHIHSDHCMGFPEILFGLLNDHTVEKHTINVCLSKLSAVFIKERLLKAWNEWFKKDKRIKLKYYEVKSGDTVQFPFFLLSVFNVNHHASSLGYSLSLNTHLISFTGDTDILDIRNSLQKDPDILFIDSSTCEPLKISGHLSVQEAVRLTERQNIHRVYLTHFLPGEQKKTENYLKSRGKKVRQVVKIAQKGLKIPL